MATPRSALTRRAGATAFLAVASCAFALCPAGDADAATATATLPINASVGLNCTFTTTPLAFGSYDPIVANNTTAALGTGGILVQCTAGAVATITLGQGLYPGGGSTAAVPLRRMNGAGADYLSYYLYSNAARTTVWGDTPATGVVFNGIGATVTTVTAYGSIAPGQNVAAGAYTDSIIATLTF